MGNIPFTARFETNIAIPPPQVSEDALPGQASPRTVVATQLEDLKIRGSIPPLDFGVSTDAGGAKAKKRVKHSSARGAEDFKDIEILGWERSSVKASHLPIRNGAEERLPLSATSVLEIQETPQPAPRLQPVQPSRTPSPLPPPSFADIATIRPATPPASLKSRAARRRIASPPPPSTSSAPTAFPTTTTPTSIALTSTSPPTSTTAPLPPTSTGSSPVSQTSETSQTSSLDPTSLTWQDSEITGHLIDPRLEPDDDGTGLNGVGFKPTPALAYARAQRRRQQVLEWRAREAREARRVRNERRNRHAGPLGDGRGGRAGSTERAGRVVRFAT
ncbi:hypothetical protein W97_06078 [Coniosporium apollinis CBS 100218]|uniref:Uncharacterized protein n=1 Tax=Coniosporium apollinis (strain CBS 100218) TaxID=1168221 RepID=R7YYH7_CONA1|nr:uncharacterized protein W97_06078 [Coniosporium apollinis CBS 100218]EON66962.1 hypothetical protein W97_06078 [Coniosporium apollinis CBS 100218]